MTCKKIPSQLSLSASRTNRNEKSADITIIFRSSPQTIAVSCKQYYDNNISVTRFVFSQRSMTARKFDSIARLAIAMKLVHGGTFRPGTKY